VCVYARVYSALVLNLAGRADAQAAAYGCQVLLHARPPTCSLPQMVSKLLPMP